MRKIEMDIKEAHEALVKDNARLERRLQEFEQLYHNLYVRHSMLQDEHYDLIQSTKETIREEVRKEERLSLQIEVMELLGGKWEIAGYGY